MYIKATRGTYEPTTLSLTPKALRETKARGEFQMFVLLKDIKRALKGKAEYIYGYWVDKSNADEDGMTLRFDVSNARIGCCYFSPEVFEKVVKAAKRVK